MRLCKLLVAIVGATVLLGAFVSSATAARLSYSANTLNTTFARMTFRGGLGTVECEVILNRTLHSRSMTKTVLSLMGYITAGNVNRCPRGSATLLRETLPWHVRYDSFAGALPAITSITTRVIGYSFRYSEPVFGIECLLRSTPEQPLSATYNLETGTGALISSTVGGTIRCGGAIEFRFEGSTTNVEETTCSRATVTVSLI